MLWALLVQANHLMYSEKDNTSKKTSLLKNPPAYSIKHIFIVVYKNLKGLFATW